MHGTTGLATARRATEILFGAEISALDDQQLTQIFADVPSQEVPRSKLETGLPLTEALLTVKLAPSKGEARRTIEQGGCYINNRSIKDVNYSLTLNDLASETVIVLRSGRKKYALLKLV